MSQSTGRPASSRTSTCRPGRRRRRCRRRPPPSAARSARSNGSSGRPIRCVAGSANERSVSPSTAGCSKISFSMKWRWLPLPISAPLIAVCRIARSAGAPVGVDHHGTLAVEEGDVALLEVLDALGQRRQRQGVRAHEHLAVAVADARAGSPCGRPPAGPRGPRTGSPARRRPRSRRTAAAAASRGARPCRGQRADQVRHHLGVGLGGEAVAVRHQLGAQLQEVLDDAVVDQRHAVADMRVGVGLVGHAVGGPAGVADAGDAAQGLRLEPLGQVGRACPGHAGARSGRPPASRSRRCRSRDTPGGAAHPAAGAPPGGCRSRQRCHT